MREMSYKSSTQETQQPKQFRGGEKKVMKKRLAMLLSVAMAFSMFANVAFGADAALTTEQKYQALVEAGIFNGIPGSNDPQLNVQTDRAQFAKILALTTGLEQVTDATSFKDANYTKSWAKGYIEAVVKAGYMNGVGGEKFNLTGKITGEQMAKSFALALGLEEVKDAAAIDGVSPWAYGWVTAIKNAGFDYSMDGKWNTPVTRAVLVDAAYAVKEAVGISVDSYKILDEKTVEFTMSDKGTQKVTLDKALVAGEEQTVKFTYKDKSFEAKVVIGALKAEKAAQTGAKTITVDFNRYVTTAEQKDLTFEVKNGLVPYSVTAKYAEDNTKVALEATFLPAGEYTVTVKGQDPFTVKVEEGRVCKIEIGIDQFQVTEKQNLKIKALNQFNEDVTGASNLNVQVEASKYGKIDTNYVDNNWYAVAPTSETKKLEKDEVIVVTALHNATGAFATKTFKSTDASSATKITLGTVAPLKDKTRIEAGDDDLVLPYEMEDQYGAKLTLPAVDKDTVTEEVYKTIRSLGSVTVTVSNPDVVDARSFYVDADGVLKFKAAGDGLVVITVYNPKTGASSTTNVKVVKTSEVKTFQISHPAQVVSEDQFAEFPYVAADNYGAPIANKNFASKSYRDQVRFLDNGAVMDASDVQWGPNGELKLRFATKGNHLVMVQNIDKKGNVTGIASQLSVTVQEKAYAYKISSLNIPTLFAVGAEKEVKKDDIKIVDQYGRAYTNFTFTITGATGTTISAGAADSKATYTVNVTDATGKTLTQNVTVTTIAMDKVTKYAINEVPTLYVTNSATQAVYGGEHGVAVSVVGKTSAGQTVQIDQDETISAITSSDVSIADVHNRTVYATGKGETTIAAWVGASKVAEITVKTSDAKPVATKVEIQDVAAAIELETTAGNNASDALNLVVTDQYGVKISAPAGKWVTSNAAVANVVGNKIVASGTGEATISFVTNNGLTASVYVVVNK